MAFVCDLKSEVPQKPAEDVEDLEDGEIEDDDDEITTAPGSAGSPIAPPNAPASVIAESHKASEKSSKEARKERKSSRHDKKHMTEAEKSVLYLHKLERIEREKRDKYRRDQVHTRRRGASMSPPPPDNHTPVTTTSNPDHHTNSDETAEEDFATSLQRVLQSVLKKDKSAQAQAAVAGVNQTNVQGAVSTTNNTATTSSTNAAAANVVDGACAEQGDGGVDAAADDEGRASADELCGRRAARRRKRERKKAVKRARLEAAITAALGPDGPQMEINDSNESTNLNGTSPSHINNNKMDNADDIVPSDYSASSDEDHNRHERKSRDKRCARRMKRRYRSTEREAAVGGGPPNKVKKGETKLGLCYSYIQGKCMNRECPYSHEYSPHMKMELCKFYLMECCAKGDKCYYLHSEFPCKYYHTGLQCKDADKCKFNHGQPLSDSFKTILCKHIETAPKEILGDFPRLNREEAMTRIALQQKKLEEKYSGEKKDNEKEDKRDIKRNRPSRWQDSDKPQEQLGSIVNLSFLHDKDQDMRFTSNNGDIDMRTLPNTSAGPPPSTIPLPATINTSTPPPNLLLSKPSPPLHHNKISCVQSPNDSVNISNHPSAALLQQLGVGDSTTAALLLAGVQSGVAGAAAVAALLQGVRHQKAQLLLGAPIVAGGLANSSTNAILNPPQLPITMQIPPPILNPNAVLFSTPPPSLLNTPPPTIRPSILNQQLNHLPCIKPTITPQNFVNHEQPPKIVTTNTSSTTSEDVKTEDSVVKSQPVVPTMIDDNELDIERYKREAGIGRTTKVEVKEEVKQEVMEVKVEEGEEDEEERCLQIDCDPLLESSEPYEEVEEKPTKPELPNLPRAQMDLFLRIQSQQAKSDKTPNTDHQSTSDTSSGNMDVSSSSNSANKDNTGDTDNTAIDWYSDDDDDDDDDNKLTIGEDAEYDDIITKSVNEVPKSTVVSKKVDSEPLLPPVVEDVPHAAQIVEKLGDLSKIDISAEVTKLLTSFTGGTKKSGEKSPPSSSIASTLTTKHSSSYTPPTDPRTGSKSPRSSTDPRSSSSDPRLSSEHPHHNRHHHRHNDSSSSPKISSSPSSSSNNNLVASSSSSTGRSDPRRRRSSAESSDGGKSSGSGGSGRAPMPSIYDQATASFRMSNKDLDLRLGGSVAPSATSAVVDSDLRSKLVDVDLRSVSQGGRPDIDLRATMPQQLSLPLQFKAAMATYTPATEIDATYHASYVWRIYEVDVPRPDYSGLRLTEAEARSTGDPRLEKIFRLASGGTVDMKADLMKEKTEFTIDESPASPVREQPVAKPTTPRADPRRRKPVEEPPTSSDPTQLTYAQQLALLQTSNFYQNLTSNQKLNLNHELSLRMQQQQQQPNAHSQHHHHQPSANNNNLPGGNDPIMAAVLHSLGLTGGNTLQQQQHQQQQMMMQLQQFGAMGLIQHLGVGGGPRGGMGGPVGGGGMPNNQQGLLGAAPGVPHDFGGPLQPPPPFVGGPPNHPPMNNPNNFNNNSPNDNYDQYEDEDSYNNCYNNNNNNNMMIRNNHRGGNNGGGGGFRDNRNNRRGGGGPQQRQNRNFNRNNRNNFRNRNRNNNGGNNQNRGGMVD